MDYTSKTPLIETWVSVPPNSDFTIHNLPFGIFSNAEKSARVGVAIGEKIIDLAELAETGLLEGFEEKAEIWFKQSSLNAFISAGKDVWFKLRVNLQKLLEVGNLTLQDRIIQERIFVEANSATLHLPVEIGDYTDFYSSIQHATNVGAMFRDPANALLPNWKHLPVAYHGRSSSIVPSGTPIIRPNGQSKPANSENPVFGPSQMLDFELETAFMIGKPNPQGDWVTTDQAEDHIFGFVLFNDWSARDIQSWEYVPLGPFLGKNFASSISPWVVSTFALEPFKVSGPIQNPEVLPYLKPTKEGHFSINMEVYIKPEGGTETRVCQSNMEYLYWSFAQQLAHHTINGCNMRVGDLLASGTISGPNPDSYGSMLELTWRGTKPITLSDGSIRKFINDYDTVIFRAYAEKDGIRIGFGEVRNQVLPAKAYPGF